MSVPLARIAEAYGDDEEFAASLKAAFRAENLLLVELKNIAESVVDERPDVAQRLVRACQRFVGNPKEIKR